MNNNQLSEQESECNIDVDLKFIENEIICLQKDGNYCKYCTPLKAISVTGLTKEQYLGYWKARYKNFSKEDVNIILTKCKDKLQNGLIDKKEMIDLVIKSKDSKKEKLKILDLLGGSLNG